MSTSEQVANEQIRDSKVAVSKVVNITERIIGEVIRETRIRNINAEVTRTSSLKNNENQKTGISIRFAGDKAAPTLYLDSAIDRIKHGDSIKDIAKEVLDTAIRVRNNGQAFGNIDINAENAKNQIYLKVLNKVTNSDMAERCPHIDIGEDLMAVPYWKLNSGNGECASFLVTKDVMKGSDLVFTEDEVLNIGRNNSIKDGFTVKGMCETLREMAGVSDEVIAEMIPIGPEQMYVVSNPEKIYGATALLDPQALESIADKIGEEKYYILPSSIHELLVIRESLAPTPEELQTMVKEVNENEVAVQDRLSDNVYRVDTNTMKISICNTTKQLQEQKELAEKIGNVLAETHRVKM